MGRTECGKKFERRNPMSFDEINSLTLLGTIKTKGLSPGSI